MGGGNSTCYSHCDCPSNEPFCYDDGFWEPYCSSCDLCEYCSYGVDGTCGSCNTDQYPVWGSYECPSYCESDSSSEQVTGCSSHWDCPCSHPFCYDHTGYSSTGVCASCTQCHTCYDGVDWTCGSCDPEVYPLYESSTCYEESHCGVDGEALLAGLIGIIAGVIIAIILCCLCVWCIYKYTQRDNEAKEALQPGSNPPVAAPSAPPQYGVEAVPMAPPMGLQLEGNGNMQRQHGQAAVGNQVRQWMRDNVRLPEYAEIFIGNGYDSLENVKRLSLADLGSMGITKMGHQRAIMAEIERLRGQTPGVVGQQQGLLMYPQPAPQAPDMAAYQYSTGS